jgi:hypothetical protein
MCRGHGDDTSFFEEKVICLISLIAQELERPNVFKLCEDLLNMSVAAVDDLLYLGSCSVGREEGDVGEVVVYKISKGFNRV